MFADSPRTSRDDPDGRYLSSGVLRGARASGSIRWSHGQEDEHLSRWPHRGIDGLLAIRVERGGAGWSTISRGTRSATAARVAGWTSAPSGHSGAQLGQTWLVLRRLRRRLLGLSGRG
ncbi:hypothetical protein Krad_2446 [Kineococcus radiotolerans SRS30216 = ATCC BAA-149]|uniref:Uncharacterized protein n=1 Tax=Kineococcus radiotolerans (strain ATCC BAA-149 / DSM 14245 / SRS30216) TaxID=266940 RepID=A6WAT6_KINRD|nr:hypothetical protein Krad_2446 [Kineococcus radiotolerans SRS30216 = ATCC BAA-149]